jgi:hypothetical protein
MRKTLLKFAIVFFAAASWAGQGAAPIVTARTVLETDAAHPGSLLEAAVLAQIAPGYHINDHKPPLDYLIPSALKMETNPRIALDSVNYPEGTPLKLAFSDKPISVYQGALVIRAKLKIAASTPPGIYNLKGKFAYQACNDHECFPPTSVAVEMAVKVVGPGVRLKRANPDVFKRVKFE